MRLKTGLVVIGLLLSLIAGSAAKAQMLINGAGATFPYPLYSQWFDLYTKVNPNVRFNYQSIGSGGGIKQLTGRTVDFGASDAPMTDAQLASAPAKILHFPTVLGAAVVTYNIEGVSSAIKLTGPLVADIYGGKIAKWNDPAIVKINPDVKLPDSDIVVIHRSDGSGTTYIFSDYLSKVSEAWKTDTGKGTSVKWPVGLGGKGNEGVTALVKQTPGSIGYIELIYALKNNLPFADLQNHDGNYVKASVDSVTAAAAASASSMPADFRVSITDAPGPNSYPISSYTYLLVYQQMPDATKGQAIIDFIKWALTSGQQYAPPLAYAPLPPAVIGAEQVQLSTVKAQADNLKLASN
jgi:phosphate transport system substrate-binding protein